MPKICVEFGGGCESFFGDQVEILFESADIPKDMRSLLNVLRKKFLTVKEELFVIPDPESTSEGVEYTIRPGILALIDDVDWEILGKLDAKLDGVNRVTFISTLHGG